MGSASPRRDGMPRDGSNEQVPPVVEMSLCESQGGSWSDDGAPASVQRALSCGAQQAAAAEVQVEAPVKADSHRTPGDNDGRAGWLDG